MSKLYNTVQVANLIGVAPETIKNWELMGYVPTSARMGLQRKRVWTQWKVDLILQFAQDNGYKVTLPVQH